ncbi:hypothetical protein predicted by Glimmer/Critica [Acetobacter senegalensis]|uniref:Uncharacterized protein n=1 Tax=Acetobacter senegalensis TaxID=446692 RepID=A0A0U5EXC6_9PROT|nr:hypothetical protein predicted by Glimmer/Critica [Acetobacter senegalensis]
MGLRNGWAIQSGGGAERQFLIRDGFFADPEDNWKKRPQYFSFT